MEEKNQIQSEAAITAPNEENRPSSKYGADQITVLEGLAAVRKRPEMYIGDRQNRGLHHLVNEVLDNSVDEAMAGHCDRIMVQINADGSCTVEDNGRGIPVGAEKSTGKPALEEIQSRFCYLPHYGDDRGPGDWEDN